MLYTCCPPWQTCSLRHQLGSILARQQLRANTKSVTFPPLSIVRYSCIQLSQQGRQWRERKCPIFETVPKEDSNPGSRDCESGVLPLSYRAPQYIVHSWMSYWVIAHVILVAIAFYNATKMCIIADHVFATSIRVVVRRQEQYPTMWTWRVDVAHLNKHNTGLYSVVAAGCQLYESAINNNANKSRFPDTSHWTATLRVLESVTIPTHVTLSQVTMGVRFDDGSGVSV